MAKYSRIKPESEFIKRFATTRHDISNLLLAVYRKLFVKGNFHDMSNVTVFMRKHSQIYRKPEPFLFAWGTKNNLIT